MKIECFFRGVIKINNSFIGEKMGGSGRRGEVVVCFCCFFKRVFCFCKVVFFLVNFMFIFVVVVFVFNFKILEDIEIIELKLV